LYPFSRRERAGWSILERRDTLASVSPAASRALDLVREGTQLALLAVEVDSRGTNVILAESIPDSRQPGYDGLKEDSG
jgi:hypothetical protein